MSLFPAFTDKHDSNDVNSKESWLKNSSFKVVLPDTAKLLKLSTSPNDEDDECSSIEESSETQNCQQSKEPIGTQSNEELFFIDRKPTKEFLTVNTISRPSVSKYKISYSMMRNENRKRKFQRYYRRVQKIHVEEKINDDGNLSTDKQGFSDEVCSFKNEEELTQTTAYYNRIVQDEPNNIEMWLKFIDFQDTVFKSERTSKKGSIAKGLRVNAERKLNILEKALFHNPTSEDLYRKRLHIMVSVYPADELQRQLKDLLHKNQANIILWQGYIEATQCSMSHCNTSSVLKLYTTCFSTLHKLRRNGNSDAKILEESILRMLYQCGLFLKQSGLFEQLWTLLKMYLEMNLGQLVPNSFDISSDFKEDQLMELENMVFKSQLPSHELWLRTEKLRESCHWLPINEECEDPQRIVFTDDIVELIQPITLPENTFTLTATILTLLKIPLLPCRHNTMQQLGLDYVPWALDSLETLLPIFYPLFHVDLKLGKFFIDYQLLIGPQYLKVMPGQEEYLCFILKVMQRCIDYLVGEDKLALVTWWFRFQKLLIILDNNGTFKLPPNLKKNFKSNIKILLKKPENRSNILFYVEYALIEKELTSHEACAKILETASSFTTHFKFEATKTNDEQKLLCFLTRTLVETRVSMCQNDIALKYLVNLALGKPITLECELSESTLVECSLKFKHVTLQLLSKNELQKLLPVKHILPIFFCDWIICHGWLIFLSKGPLACGTFLEDILEKMDQNSDEKLLQTEIIFEFYVAVIFKFCVTNPGFGLFKALDDIMYRALQYFPNNLFFLSVLAKEQLLLNSLGPKLWKTKNILLKGGHAFPISLMISITNQVIINLQQQLSDTITGKQEDMNNNSNFKNVMLSLFRAVTKPNMCTRRCGLIWRLYLQFVHKYFDPKLCRQIYYCAVEECPWLKALYIDAAIYIPAELSQIQDLLVEKQLRIHICPEELDILRD